MAVHPATITHICVRIFRNALSSMKPAGDSTVLPEGSLGKRGKVLPDEAVNGEYGLVVNGHSLVRGQEASPSTTLFATPVWPIASRSYATPASDPPRSLRPTPWSAAWSWIS